MDPTLANLLRETQAPHFDMRVATARLARGLPWESRPGVHFGDRYMTVKRLDDSTLVGIATLTGASHLNEPNLVEIKPLAMAVMLALTRRHKNHRDRFFLDHDTAPPAGRSPAPAQNLNQFSTCVA